VRLKGKGLNVCFAKHTPSPKKIGPAGLEAQLGSTVPVFFWAGSRPTIWARLDLVDLAWSLARPSDQAGHYQ